jgi:arsenite oxidase large subunit
MANTDEREFPKVTQIITTGCQYCAVGCGYQAFLVPEDADLNDRETRKHVSEYITPAMRNRVKYMGKVVDAAVVPDPLCVLNGRSGGSFKYSGNHSVRGGSQGANLVTADGSGRSTQDRLKSPLVRLSDGTWQEIDWKTLNSVMAKLVARAVDLKPLIEDKDSSGQISISNPIRFITNQIAKIFGLATSSNNAIPTAKLKIQNPKGLGVKLYEYQYLENTYAATKLFFSALGTPNVAFHDRPSVADSSPGFQDAGFDPHEFSYEDVKGANIILVVGTNPYENQSVLFMNYMSDKKMIVIDPRRTATAQYAEANGLHLQPTSLGADSLVLYAIARAIIERYEVENPGKEFPTLLQLGKNADDFIKNTLLKEESDKKNSDKKRRASRILDFQGFRIFLGVGDALQTLYTIENAAEVSGIDRQKLEATIDLLYKEFIGDGKIGILYEKGMIWGFNYHNTSAIASLGLLLGSYGDVGKFTGRVGGHQKGWAESRVDLRQHFEDTSNATSTSQGYPFRNSVDTYTDSYLSDLGASQVGVSKEIQIRHNIDLHVFGVPEERIESRDNITGTVRLNNGVTTLATPDVRLLWIIGNNYFGQTNDAQRKRSMLEKRLLVGSEDGKNILRPKTASEEDIVAALSKRMETFSEGLGGLVLIHQEIFPNPTTEFCDLVIPAAGWGEDDFCRYNAQRRLKLYERFQDMPLHPVDAAVIDGDPIKQIHEFKHSPKPDWMIFRDIAWTIAEQADQNMSGHTSFLETFKRDIFPWQNSSEIADELASKSPTGQANSNRVNLLGALVDFGKNNDELKDRKDIVHTLLGKRGNGQSTWLAGFYSVLGENYSEDEKKSASNGVLLPVKYIADEKRLEGTLRNKSTGELFFAKAPWGEIDPEFQRNKISSSSNPDEVIIINGRVNEVWNNMFHHLRNEYINERYPEDLPGTLLEINPKWADDRKIKNGQILEIESNNNKFRAIASLQTSVPMRSAFALFSYPVREEGKFTFSGYVNNVTDGYWDGINPIAALKYGRGIIKKVCNPNNVSDDWIFDDKDFPNRVPRLGPSFSERVVV